MEETNLFPVVTRVINGATYSVTTFPAGVAFKLLYELKDVLGDAAVGAMSKDIENTISRIGGNYSQEEFLQLMLRILSSTHVEGQTQELSVIFDKYFAGKLGTTVKVAAFVLEVNFGDFFDEMKNAMQQSVTMMQTVLQETQKATSTSSPSQKTSSTSGLSTD